MKTKLNLLVAGMLLAATSSALATVRYVNINNANPTPPFLTWATAATNIQDAVDAAGAGDEIVVTNGTYAPVTVNTPLTLQSINGPAVTIINGGGTAQCVYLATNAVMVGFTLTNGFAYQIGAGVYCASTNAVLTNCVLTGNSAYGGSGGGAYGGTLNDCTLTGNSGLYGGGAVGCTLNNCILSSNWVNWNVVFAPGPIGGYGGGACDSTLNNCTLTGNSVAGCGGGAYDCTLNNCTLTGNSATGYYYQGIAGFYFYSPGFGGGAFGSTLNNCAVSGNNGDGADESTLNNCTITGNSGWGASSATLNNCIVYFNTDPNDGDNYDPSSTLNYCCTTPMPTNGVGNISADPQLASATHLSAQSPCIGAGSATYASGTDIDGDAWNNPPSIGCDEYHAGAVTGPLTVSLTATLTNVLIGNPVGLTAFIAGRTDLSVWDFGDGFVEVNEPYTSHTWTSPGYYLVALWAFNDSYPEGVSATVTIYVDEGKHYVAASSENPVAPYTSWATAATNIQDAVDVAPPGATIFVTNGVYAGGNQVDPYGVPNCVVVDTPLTLQSVNGPDVTVINGGGAVQCLYLTNDAVLVGFTLTSGRSSSPGAGVYCESTNSVLTNCVLTGNLAGGHPNGGFSSQGAGGGACGGTLNNCTLTGNGAIGGRTEDGLPLFSFGGGASGCTLNNCTLTNNSADYGGGASGCTLNNCTLTGNSAPGGYGGGACDSALNSCSLSGNSAGVGGATYSDGYQPCTLNNCTLTGNSAYYDGGGAYSCSLYNCIVYFNSDTNGGNYDSFSTLNYCCTTPMPTNGVGNITNAPLFVDQANGNLRLQSNSPCINSGDNAYVVGSTDLDGRPRIVGGTVDMGAYEFQPGVSGLFIGWLQQYGLPTDGSADYADTDGNGMNNWQKWIAGLNPTDASSVLKMTSATATNNPAGLVVTWESVNTRTYYLQSSTNLAAQPAFSTIQSNIVGQPGTTSYTDTNAVGSGPYFYRVGVGN